MLVTPPNMVIVRRQRETGGPLKEKRNVLVFSGFQSRNHRFKELDIVLHIANSPSQRLERFLLRCTELMVLIDGIKDHLNTGQDACQNGDNCDGVHGCRKQGACGALAPF